MTAQSLLNALLHQKASANDELLDAIARLGEEAPPHDLQAALRILNHAHVVDRIFAAHLEGTGHTYTANWFEETPPLARLSSDIRETDRWYLDYVARIGVPDFDESIDFSFTDGSRGRMSRAEMLAHVVTHSGYHRGQVGRVLPQVRAAALRDGFAGYLHRSDPARRDP